MFTYKKPNINSLESDKLMEISGPAMTAGYLDIGAARMEVLLGQNNQNNVVICKIIEQKDTIVRLG